MEDLSTILVPVDFSPRCRGAAQYAEALASRFGARIVLLHVVITPVVPYGPSEALAYSSVSDFDEEHFTHQKALLENFLADELKDAPVQRVALRGDPAQVIARFATDEGCDLIVMPTHAYGPFRRMLLGSVTAKVLHDAHCPVLTGPHMEGAPDHTFIRFDKVLCAVDFGQDTGPTYQWAERFARDCGAELAVLHVLPGPAMHIGPIHVDPEWRERMTRQARERLEALFAESQMKTSVRIASGDVVDAVSQAAREGEASLLVIGRGRTSGMLGRLRANACAILRESPCPVVTV